ncbi:uncharacterized protein C119.09c-like [Triticum aestivum]|uniref:uncharacterized protein C119.09c-like n=1 Tax=Triticum aestivum TaxID=4565 RepID=UPI001D017AEA|nr:uncharacterized protein C119.09c-like [Triticum aestivum]
MVKLYVQAVPPPDLNKNTEWFMYLVVWTTYIFILFVSWVLILSIFGCTPSMAWTLVNLGHFAITYHFFHWKKGTPFADDQAICNRLTWWEQIDNGKQLTRNIKFLVVVPVVLSVLFCFNFINTAFGSLSSKEQHGKITSDACVIFDGQQLANFVVLQLNERNFSLYVPSLLLRRLSMPVSLQHLR